jgi:hypothetical protein
MLAGAVHKPQALRLPADMSAFELPDGSLPPICSALKASGQAGAHIDACGLCCFAKLPGLQSPSASDLSPMVVRGERISTVAVSFSEPAQRFAVLGARGPPWA